MDKRPDKDTYYLDIAAAISKRSTCLRRQYGAVIVNNDEVIATGYNGAPRGEANCNEAGICWREAHNIPHGEQYEKCVSVHAEMNAIISAARKEMLGGTLFLYGYEGKEVMQNPLPCTICRRLIKNAGINRVVNLNGDISIEID